MTPVGTGAIPGNPERLRYGIEGLARTADVMGRLNDRVAELLVPGRSRAVEGVTGDLTEVVTLIQRAHTRFSRTGAALEEYHRQLARAHEAGDEAQRQIAVLEAELSDPLDEEHSAELTAQRLRANLSIIEIRNDVERHAEHTITQIQPFLADLNDGLFRTIGSFAERSLGWTQTAEEWTERVFASAWGSLKRIISTVRSSVTSVNVLLNASLVVGALNPAFGMVGLAATLGAVGFAIRSILSDVVRPAPTVRRIPIEVQGTTEPGWIGDALVDTVEVDRLSSMVPPAWAPEVADSGETVIKVTKVVGVDGSVRWRVVLPSTQEWLTTWPGVDRGMTNDLDANIALMLTPMLKTQYERGVLEALAQAEVQREDPVMLVGFSQGGIMAGHLAAYNTSYNWESIVVSGAPIDGMPIPAHTSVVSVQHRGDPVHHLDTFISASGARLNVFNWMTLAVEARGDGSLAAKHSAATYADSLRREGDRVLERFPGLSAFFVTEGAAAGSATTYYGWAEQ